MVTASHAPFTYSHCVFLCLQRGMCVFPLTFFDALIVAGRPIIDDETRARRVLHLASFFRMCRDHGRVRHSHRHIHFTHALSAAGVWVGAHTRARAHANTHLRRTRTHARTAHTGTYTWSHSYSQHTHTRARIRTHTRKATAHTRADIALAQARHKRRDARTYTQPPTHTGVHSTRTQAEAHTITGACTLKRKHA